jgi:hypothetical protein
MVEEEAHFTEQSVAGRASCGTFPFVRVSQQFGRDGSALAAGVRTPYACRVTTGRRLRHTYEEYLRALEVSPLKLEYCEGEIYAMGGGTPAHAELAASITRLLDTTGGPR